MDPERPRSVGGSCSSCSALLPGNTPVAAARLCSRASSSGSSDSGSNSVRNSGSEGGDNAGDKTGGGSNGGRNVNTGSANNGRSSTSPRFVKSRQVSPKSPLVAVSDGLKMDRPTTPQPQDPIPETDTSDVESVLG